MSVLTLRLVFIQRPIRARPQPHLVNIQYNAGMAIRIRTVLLPSPPSMQAQNPLSPSITPASYRASVIGAIIIPATAPSAPLKINDRVVIRKADYKAKFLTLYNRDYFKILRTKLKWGE